VVVVFVALVTPGRVVKGMVVALLGLLVTVVNKVSEQKPQSSV